MIIFKKKRKKRKKKKKKKKKMREKTLGGHPVLTLSLSGALPSYRLEAATGDLNRAVEVRRKLIEKNTGNDGVLGKLPHEHYDYKVGCCGGCCFYCFAIFVVNLVVFSFTKMCFLFIPDPHPFSHPFLISQSSHTHDH